MIRYTLKRVAAGILTLWLLATLVFFLLELIPGEPFADPVHMTDEVLEVLNARYHLSDPLPVRYVRWLNDLLHLNLGVSIKSTGTSVSSVISECLPVSLRIALPGTLIGAALGIGLGSIAAYRRKGFWAYFSEGLAVALMSATVILLAPLLQIVFGVQLKWLPVALLTSPAHYVLPIASIALITMANVARVARSSIRDVLRQDYVQMARSSGMLERDLFFRHVLRNSAIPVVNLIGLCLIGNTVGGFYLENVYAIPGLGKYLIQSLLSSDYGMVMGLTVFYGALFVGVSICMDLLYGLINPRIRIAAGDIR